MPSRCCSCWRSAPRLCRRRADDGGLRLPPARLTLATERVVAPQGQFVVHLPLLAKPRAAAPPVIGRFGASPDTVKPGGKSTLSWVVSGATSLYISPGIGAMTGSSVVVRPAARIEYTLTATNAGGSVQARTIVDVQSGGPSDAGALWLPYTITGNNVLPTYGTSVAVDNQGGIHAAYPIYVGTENGNRPVSYAYCPAHCADKARWTRIKLDGYVQDVRLVLDPNGKPRMILFGPKDGPGSTFSQYRYAQCDSGCTSPANWRITTIVTPAETTVTREYNNNHYFAIDRQGRMAFIYTDTTQNNHPGAFYVSCAADCLNPGSWVETTLSTPGIFDKPSLAFSPSGPPQLAFGFWDANENLTLGYAQCDSNCTDPRQWSGAGLTPVHGTTMYSLQVDTAGRPRLAFFSGSYPPAPFDAHYLYYIWCDQSCVSPNAEWHAAKLGLPFSTGDGVDLALDKQNRPRMSYENAGQGLGYSWCNTNCESDGAAWQTREVESKASLANNYEVLPIHRCTISTWFDGQRTSLALDPAGNPRIGYDAQHWWYGTEIVNGVPRDCDFNDVTVTRFALLGQP